MEARIESLLNEIPLASGGVPPSTLFTHVQSGAQVTLGALAETYISQHPFFGQAAPGKHTVPYSSNGPAFTVFAGTVPINVDVQMTIDVDISDHEIAWSCSEYRDAAEGPLAWAMTGEIPEPSTGQTEVIRVTFNVDAAGRLQLDPPGPVLFEAKAGGIAILRATFTDKHTKGRTGTTAWRPLRATAMLGDQTIGAPLFDAQASES